MRPIPRAVLPPALALCTAILAAEPSGLAVEPGASASPSAAASEKSPRDEGEPCLPANPNLPFVLAHLLPCRSPLKPQGLVLYSILSRMQITRSEGVGPLSVPLIMPLRSLMDRDSQAFVVLPPLSTAAPLNIGSRWRDGLSTLAPFTPPTPVGALLPAAAVPVPMSPPIVPAETRPQQVPMPGASPPPPLAVPMPSSPFLSGAASSPMFPGSAR